MEQLHVRYRPQDFGDVVGQDATVRSLRKVLADDSSRAFLFTGPSGTGKTTLARIVAEQAGCQSQDLLEIDAATHTGVDDMRAVAAGLQYRPLGVGSIRAVIIDECHALSKNAWQSLLKILEEPPPHVWWFLCTTEPTRVLPTIRTRCTAYDLRPVSTPTLTDLLSGVAEEEGWEPEQAVLQLCAKEAGGSPRQALVNLGLCAGVSVKEARELLRTSGEDAEAVELARALVKGESWSTVQGLLSDLSDTNPESIRHVVRGYVTKVVLGANREEQAGRALEILDAFSEPCAPQDGITPIVLACGRVLLSGE